MKTQNGENGESINEISNRRRLGEIWQYQPNENISVSISSNMKSAATSEAGGVMKWQYQWRNNNNSQLSA